MPQRAINQYSVELNSGVWCQKRQKNWTDQGDKESTAKILSSQLKNTHAQGCAPKEGYQSIPHIASEIDFIYVTGKSIKSIKNK